MMKRINTQYRSSEEISLEALQEFLQEGIYEEDFVVLYDDESSEDYIQMAEMGGKFVLEVRLHTEKDFQHFRSYWDTAEETTPIFVAFYNNQPIDFEYWEEVTQEFKEEN
ncbi:hypothetical protein [Capnocytophaga felis]|uniref:Uncharacterized protein n=1 Tax=Capnocytophaga felis TaxID=2267611 RepID=A0A5M4B745_9FLAO|nr:hypothetical protein [Capnocytophaga felis]GET44996.1 hypothetical protein RCZ01_02980 [Capnocytophaga felis]GET47841.1 hypothetical protein RCZ02_06720 [Capnocytophaga felis]